MVPADKQKLPQKHMSQKLSAQKPPAQSKISVSTVASSNKPVTRKVDETDSPTAYVIGDAEEDFQILQERGYATLLDFDEPETYNQINRRREEEEIQRYNFDYFVQRQREEQDMENYGSENDDGAASYGNVNEYDQEDNEKPIKSD